MRKEIDDLNGSMGFFILFVFGFVSVLGHSRPKQVCNPEALARAGEQYTRSDFLFNSGYFHRRYNRHFVAQLAALDDYQFAILQRVIACVNTRACGAKIEGLDGWLKYTEKFNRDKEGLSRTMTELEEALILARNNPDSTVRLNVDEDKLNLHRSSWPKSIDLALVPRRGVARHIEIKTVSDIGSLPRVYRNFAKKVADQQLDNESIELSVYLDLSPALENDVSLKFVSPNGDYTVLRPDGGMAGSATPRRMGERNVFIDSISTYSAENPSSPINQMNTIHFINRQTTPPTRVTLKRHPARRDSQVDPGWRISKVQSLQILPSQRRAGSGN